MQLSPVSSNKLYVQIYNQLVEAIRSGMFKVGEKLPSEKELCQTFNVSRVPVREALCALELNGLVDSIQGVGVYVKKTSTTIPDAPGNIEPQDIIAARLSIEPDIAKAAAKNITDTGREEMRRIIDRFRENADANIDTADIDKEFHLCAARVSANYMYLQMMEVVFKAMDTEMWTLICSRTVGTKYFRQNYEEHRVIGDMIMSGNAEGAYICMKEHMENLVERYWE